jgi:NDP-sugar pyrophosphorylase family protein
MQAVILAAGRGTRMKELTEDRPKGLLEVSGRALLEYTLDALPDSVDEIIFIVGYLGGMIHDKFGARYFGKNILYVEQEELNGTAGALWQAKDVLKDKFLVLNGDDIYDRKDIAHLTEQEAWALLVAHTEEGGKIVLDREGNIVDVVEGQHGNRDLSSANVFWLDTKIFDQKPIPKAAGSSEFGLPQTMIAAGRAFSVAIKPVETTHWIQISRPEDLKRAEEQLASR